MATRLSQSPLPAKAKYTERHEWRSQADSGADTEVIGCHS
jgi:hypothetical protein